MNIFVYLCREAEGITEGSLSDLKDASWWIENRDARRRIFVEMLGLDRYLDSGERDPPDARVTGVLDRQDYRVEKIYFESLPKLYVAGNLYIPERYEPPYPAVLYLCGHSFDQLYHYQAHARRFA